MSEEENFAVYEEALDDIEALHSSPQVMAKAKKRMQDPNVELDDIVELINTDAGLTADIIRISNSAYYGFESESSSLQDAVSRIGFREVIRLIGFSLSKTMLAKSLDHYQLGAVDFWSQSVCMALMMESIAEHTGDDKQDAYTIGLLHSVGKIVINIILEEHKPEEMWDGTGYPDEWEREIVGFTYAYAGAMILRRWGFPTQIFHPILYQFNEPDPKVDWSLHTSLYVSKCLLEITGEGFFNEMCDLGELQPYLELLKLDEDKTREIIAKNRENYLRLKSSLGMNNPEV